ncbi:MAG: hypothetical protein U1C33_01075, partial [Candidatus Cloacimonadaceae bacterium]|nr:hypothetical protein [Candidatus Cloacimonadaceae bacterium]
MKDATSLKNLTCDAIERHRSAIFNPKTIFCLALLLMLSSLIAREPEEILGPESGYLDPRWRSDDKVVAIKAESEFIPDKLHYERGEIVTVKYDFRLDSTSRGYKPNRTYYLLSRYVTGYRIKVDGDDCYWHIIKSDIDTLEIISDNRSLTGEFTLQLLRYRGKPQVSKNSEGGFVSLAPIDTTSTISGIKSVPPRFLFEIVRLAESDSGDNVYLHSSGTFFCDQRSDLSFQGKAVAERWKK